MSQTLSHIRNFSIVAHIDHGKSTLSDRLIQECGAIEEREMTAQILDSMDIEKERGITIKAQTVRLNYKADDGKNYMLNLMDTPGHVDFGYEVSRCLAACEGSILVVDSTQGVEAQTLANVYQAIDNNHEIVPVLNKIDLPASDPEKVQKQIEEVIGIDASEAILVSAKTGVGIHETLEAVIKRLPAPKGNPDDDFKAAQFTPELHARPEIILNLDHGMRGLGTGLMVDTLPAYQLHDHEYHFTFEFCWEK